MLGFSGGLLQLVLMVATFLVLSPSPNLANVQTLHHSASDIPRLCPGCVTGDCATTTMVSGLPIVQLVVATAVGFIWAAIFIWLYASFYEGGTSKRSGDDGSWSWFITPSKVQNEEAEGMNRSGSLVDYTRSGQNLIMVTNLALDAIHFLGDKFF